MFVVNLKNKKSKRETDDNEIDFVSNTRSHIPY